MAQAIQVVLENPGFDHSASDFVMPKLDSPDTLPIDEDEDDPTSSIG
jgi:hypothetical protein